MLGAPGQRTGQRGRFKKGNNKGKLGGYFGKINWVSGRRNSPRIVTSSKYAFFLTISSRSSVALLGTVFRRSSTDPVTTIAARLSEWCLVALRASGGKPNLC